MDPRSIFFLVGAVNFGGDQFANEFYLPFLNIYVDREDSQGFGTDSVLFTV